MSSNEHSWMLISAHQRSLALMSIHEFVLRHHQSSRVLMSANGPMAPRSWLLLSSHECSLLYGAKLMSVHGCSWLLMAAHEHLWLILAAYVCIWVLTGAFECLWLYMSTHQQPWTPMSLGPWSIEHSWELKISDELGVMGPWALVSTHKR